MKTVKMTFDFDEKIAQKFTEYAAQTGESHSHLANDIFTEWFEDLEADYDAAIAALEEFKASGEKTYTSEEILAAV